MANQQKSRVITFLDGKKYTAIIKREQDELNRQTRYEITVDKGISTGEVDSVGDNPTFSWVFPAESIDKAVNMFISRIEEIREETGYYELSNQYI